MLNQQVRITEDKHTIVIFANGTRFVFFRDQSFDRLVEMFQELQIDDVTYKNEEK